jgi:hypothetical protein
MRTTEKIANYSRYRGVIEVLRETDPPDVGVTPNTTDTDGQLFEAWRQFISSTGPYGYFWTLSFVHPYTDLVCLESLWESVKRINRSMYGPRWSKNEKGLHATVIAERHKMSQFARGRLHFHVLIETPEADVTPERFSALVIKAGLQLRDQGGRPMSAPERIDVQEVSDPEGLASYLTKDLRTSQWPLGDNLFFLSPQGPCGVVLRPQSLDVLASLH